MDSLIFTVTEIIISGISLISVVLIIIGVISALYILTVKYWQNLHKNYYAVVRLTLSQYLLLALEFQIAADILQTVLKPSWEEFGRLAATIAVRSVLSYILMLEARSNT